MFNREVRKHLRAVLAGKKLHLDDSATTRATLLTVGGVGACGNGVRVDSRPCGGMRVDVHGLALARLGLRPQPDARSFRKMGPLTRCGRAGVASLKAPCRPLPAPTCPACPAALSQLQQHVQRGGRHASHGAGRVHGLAGQHCQVGACWGCGLRRSLAAVPPFLEPAWHLPRALCWTHPLFSAGMKPYRS